MHGNFCIILKSHFFVCDIIDVDECKGNHSFLSLYNFVTKEENVLSRLTFLKACRLDVFFIKHCDQSRFILHEEKNQSRQKLKAH